MERRKEQTGVRSDYLLLSAISPHKPVDSSAIGRWTKEWLDVGSYSAHSTRGASVSHAADAGIAVDSVLKSADWASESSFARFTSGRGLSQLGWILWLSFFSAFKSLVESNAKRER